MGAEELGLPKQDCGDGLLRYHSMCTQRTHVYTAGVHTLPSGSGDASAEVCVRGWVAGKVGLRLGISQTDTSWEVKRTDSVTGVYLAKSNSRQLLPPDNRHFIAAGNGGSFTKQQIILGEASGPCERASRGADTDVGLTPQLSGSQTWPWTTAAWQGLRQP